MKLKAPQEMIDSKTDGVHAGDFYRIDKETGCIEIPDGHNDQLLLNMGFTRVTDEPAKADDKQAVASIDDLHKTDE